MPVLTTDLHDIIIADGQVLTAWGIQYLIKGNINNRVIEVKEKHALLESITEKTTLAIIDYLTVKDFNINDFELLKDQYPALSILVITADQNKDSILAVLDSGVRGFLFKDCSEEEITRTIDKILDGEKSYCNRIFDILLMETRQAKASDDSLSTELSPREIDILKLIVAGKSTALMAEHLNLSPHTISTHRKNILKKLKIKSPVELVTYAYDMGFISGK